MDLLDIKSHLKVREAFPSVWPPEEGVLVMD